MNIGHDYYWWWLPTHPELKVNLYERTWDKKSIRQQRRAEEYEKDLDDSDPDKKMFSIE